MAMAYEKIPFEQGQSFRLLRWVDNVSDVEICLPGSETVRLQGAGERWHFHPEVELTLVTRGSGRRFVGDHLTSFDGPDLVLIGSNIPHCWTGLRNSAGFSLQFVLDDSHPLWQLAETSSLQSLNKLAAQGAQFHGPILSQAERIFSQIATADPLNGLRGFLDLIAQIVATEDSFTKRLSNTKFALTGRDHHLEAIAGAVKYILGNLCEEIRLDDLVAVTHMSKPTFCRHFKLHTGRTLVAFVNELRIDHARKLLIDTNLPITEVAFDSGFTNLANFNRQFRQVCACSPREYRALNQSPS